MVDQPRVEAESVTRAVRGLESEVLLARARARLLGPVAEAVDAKIGRYRVVRRIGAGGMGVVYEARDDELDRAVAIKLLRAGLAESLAAGRRLVREA